MDKKRLNNEIILCRGVVRKARVAVIRKIIKKMKILKSCKNEALKEKKLKKSERLFKKIQIMKKLKDDDITKFALNNKDLDKFLKESSNLKKNAMACLAKHEAVVKKVENIREQIPNWETELPLLLDSLGKKKIGRKTKVKNIKEHSVKSVEKIPSEVPKQSKQVHKSAKANGRSDKKEIVSKVIECVNSSFEDKSESEEISEASVEELQPLNKEEKIDDPFFIEKKIIAPKLLQEPPPKENLERKRFQREGSNSTFHTKPFKVKKESRFSNNVKKSVVEDEKLHPSWAAKKVQLIKPFEGKKIKFSD